ncbi:MAG: CHRD domain-containing protein [Vicinamibacterales bacterium]
MRRVLSLLSVSALVLLGSAAQAQAQTISFPTITLSGQNENPGVLTGAVGSATVSLNLATQQVTYRVDVFNLPVGATAGHFHVGASGQNGPVVVNFTVPAGISNDFGISGTASATDLVPRAPQGINSWEDFIQALLLGNVYINIHSTNNPGGEVRGQVPRAQ